MARSLLLAAATSSSATAAGAYSCGWIQGNRRWQRVAKGSTGRLASLFSSSADGPATGPDTVPDIFVPGACIDFATVHDVDWGEMDPFNEIPFDDFEEMYIQGKARGDASLSKPGCDASYDSVMTDWDESVPTLNHLSLVGRVGSPPEARYFDNPLGDGNNNKPNVVVTMSLALPRYYSSWEREQEGVSFGQEETEWFNLEVWGYLAEWTLKNVQKGSRIGVVGAIDTDFYRNKNTDMLSTNPKLLVQDLDILESKMEADTRRNNNKGNGNNYYNNGGSGNYNNNYANEQQGYNERGPSFFTDDDDDDVYDPSGGGSAGGFFDPM